MVGHIKTLGILSALAAAAILAACGGGGGSGVNPPPPPGSSPTPAASPGLVGTLNFVNTGTTYTTVTYAPAGTVGVDFSCGCTAVAGSGTTDGSGNFTLTAVSTPVPQPNPMYTIRPTRNYLEVGSPTSGTQAWTMIFAGSIPSHDQYLNPGNQLVSAPSDVFSAAVALYVFQFSSNSGVAYDEYNFNQLVAWYNQLKNGTPTAHEVALLNHIVTESTAHHVLWPTAPGWRSGQSTNATIHTDLINVHSDGTAADPQLPTPCPGGAGMCTGTPSP